MRKDSKAKDEFELIHTLVLSAWIIFIFTLRVSNILFAASINKCKCAHTVSPLWLTDDNKGNNILFVFNIWVELKMQPEVNKVIDAECLIKWLWTPLVQQAEIAFLLLIMMLIMTENYFIFHPD